MLEAKPPLPTMLAYVWAMLLTRRCAGFMSFTILYVVLPMSMTTFAVATIASATFALSWIVVIVCQDISLAFLSSSRISLMAWLVFWAAVFISCCGLLREYG